MSSPLLGPEGSIAVKTPAQALAGLTLEDGWLVEGLAERSSKATGGFFSVGYLVRAADGTRAFLKALDLSPAFGAPDLPTALEALTVAYNFERRLLHKCREQRLSRVALPIADGKIDVPGFEAPLARVNYLIFELADGDVRAHLDAAEAFDLAWRLRSLHHVATGLQQLHGRGIAHQDLKPSNVLVYRAAESKVGDLGRAIDRTTIAPHEDSPFAGDVGYAPPELLYGFVPTEWSSRRLGCDAYLLGSLIVFFFCRVSMTAAVSSLLAPSHDRRVWGDGFEAILPFVRAAFEQVIEAFDAEARRQAPDLVEELVQMVRELCEPDPRLRGDPRARGNPTTQFELHRYITRLDLLSRKAEILYRRRP